MPECLFVCLPVFRGGLPDRDFVFLVFAGLDLRLVVEDCLLLWVQGFVVAVGVSESRSSLMLRLASSSTCVDVSCFCPLTLTLSRGERGHIVAIQP